MSASYQLIVGYGISGRSIADFFRKKNVSYLIYDDALSQDGLSIWIGFDDLIKNIHACSKAIISPGIPPHHKIIKLLQEHNVPLVTDIDLLIENKCCKKIAITGTNGKSTVTTWLAQALSQEYARWHAVGNIGCSVLDAPDDAAGLVVELSSAQLHYTQKPTFDCSVLLPIDADHLDWHGSKEAYQLSKLKLLSNKNVVVHVDLLEHVDDAKQVISYGVGGDVFWHENTICLPDGTSIGFDDKHYWRAVDKDNLCAVMAVLFFMGQPMTVIENYSYLPYRSAQYELKNGWTIVNDSKATNLHASHHALAALRAAHPQKAIVLLMGGVYKEPFIYPDMREKDQVFIFGALSKSVHDKHASAIKFVSLHAATQYLNNYMNEALPGIVLLAPGGASFDEFSNYHERGMMFDLWMGKP